jgi:Flp pilus assembly protein TadG
MIHSAPIRQILHAGRDRSGAVSVLMAVMGTVLIGFCALGAEVGRWYLTHRQMQTAADEAAVAGAIELAGGSGSTNPTTAALDLATRNGFTASAQTLITVRTPPQSGPMAGVAGAVEVIITQQQPLFLAKILMNTAPTITARAVANVQGTAKACALALTGGLLMGGNSFSSGPNCILSSNSTGSQSISVTGSADVVAYSLSSVGGCYGCATSQVKLTKPYAEYQLPVSNPYAPLDKKTFTTTCSSLPSGSSITPTGLTHAYCSSLTVNGGKSLNFAPGTYIFSNASITANGGATITCSACTNGAGVTIILTGNPATIGGLILNGNSIVNLVAPMTNADDPAFNGVLFYQDKRATSGGSTLNGGDNSFLSGAMYFPSSYVNFLGNSGVHFSSCTALVAGTLDFTGSASTYIDVSGCVDNNVAVPQVQVVRLVE